MKRLAAALIALALTAVLVAPGAAQEEAPKTEAQRLIELLENDEAWAALIDSLKQAEAATGEGDAPAPPPPASLGREIAEFTKGAAERAADAFGAVRTQIERAPEAFRSLSPGQIAILIDALQALALVIVATMAVYLALRVAARRLYRRLGAATHDAGVLRTAAILVATTLIDVMVVVAAWGAGYLAALVFYGDVGVIGVRQSLYLNAFLIVGMVRVLIGAVLSPATGELRFVAVSDAAARRMARWFGLIASILGYGQLLIVPIVNRQASLAAGRGVSTLLAVVAILLAAALVWRWRREVAAWLLGEDPEGKGGFARFLARNWHVPANLYLFWLFVVVAARPDGLLWPILVDSAQVLGVIVGGLALSGAVSRSISRGVHVPEALSLRLPALESRLGAFVPKALMAVRAVIVFAVAAFALDALDLIDMRAWIEGDFGARAVGALASIAGILLFGFAIWLALASWIDFRLNPAYGSVPTAREQTLLSLLKNAATVLLIVVIMMFVLSELGVDIAPLIASAGVLGLAIGFGAQKMVQDIITGVFIQFENAMNVGDVVTLNGTTGVVEKLTIRSVSLRDVEGAFHIIPFSSVDMVSNYMKDYGNFVCDMGIAYRENVADGKQAMLDAFDELKAGEFGEQIMGDLQWFGVQTLGDSAVVLRARIKCRAGQQWAVGRAYNEICKRVMDERGIEIPFPHQTIYFGVDKDGEAPPLKLAGEGRSEAKTPAS